MPSVIPLERWPLARKKWRLEVDDHDLTVITPHVKEPWTIPLTSISGVCDLSRQAASHDELTLMRGAHMLDMETKATVSSSNLLVVLKPPQPLPPLRFGHRHRSRLSRHAAREGAPLDGFSVQAIEPDGSAFLLVDRGVKRFRSERDALIAAIGAVPISTLPEPEQRRVRRRERMRAIGGGLAIALVIAFIVARVALNVPAIERLESLLFVVLAAALVVTFSVVAYVRRQDRRPITTGRAPPSRPIQ